MRIRQDGFILEILKGDKFTVKLEDDAQHEVTAILCGRMRINRIDLCKGDGVTVELSPYDLYKGRITWRQKNERPNL